MKLETAAVPQSRPFPYHDYVRARETLLSALGGPRFYATLTVPSGMGKTCLVR